MRKQEKLVNILRYGIFLVAKKSKIIKKKHDCFLKKVFCNFSLHIYEISGYQSIFSDLETFFVQKYDQNQIYKNAILGTVVKLQIEINAHKNAHRALFF